MSRLRKTSAVLSAVGVAVALTTAASAGTTTIRENDATGAPYSGSVTGSLISNTSHFVSSFVTVDCTGSSLGGSVNSDGTALNIGQASWSGCTNNLGGTTTVTALNLPWSGGSVVYGPQAGGRDGTMTMSGVLTRVDNKDAFGITTTCYYHGSGQGGALTGDVYNRDNAARPEPDDDGQGRADNAPLALVDNATYNSGALCSSTATFTATYALRGSGGTKLYLTS